ncbi:hypothetical protein C882_2050 [Caenispirillum salinarum AK4]|uniref:Secreted protein n=1 Tax=Caenispirillum salinarum AK4 TaxID=1238182 RepID=K9HEN8_9PROT|nr:hypothetical protein [Caenispirillum salinarum]EKV27121.1 hypothetical protein C882_2050 [Caenispirillum salinarum AK4]
MMLRSIAAAALAGALLVPAAPPAIAQVGGESALTHETAPLDNPSHLDLQKALIAWLRCTDATPEKVDLERIQMRLLQTVEVPKSESEALAELEAAAREMGEVVAEDGCDSPRVERHIALFDTYLRPALEQ